MSEEGSWTVCGREPGPVADSVVEPPGEETAVAGTDALVGKSVVAEVAVREMPPLSCRGLERCGEAEGR